MSITSISGKIQRFFQKMAWVVFYIIRPSIKPGKMVVCSYKARGYSDNSKALVDEILRQNLPIDIIIVSQKSEGIPAQATIVKPDSISFVYHMVTAQFWIDNQRKSYRTRKRKGQYYIQTWHGFPLKKIERDVEEKLPRSYVRSAKNDSKMCDLMVSNSTFLTRIYQNSFWYDGEVIECGFPRNDIFFREENRNAILKNAKIPENKKILLYAPTFRNSWSPESYHLDFEKILLALESRFGGEWVACLRLHPNISSKSGHLSLSNHAVIDVTSHPDTQELLLVADALITDYSSLMFDYLLSNKPGFIYANDIEAYTKERGFYYDLHTVPYVVSTTEPELCQSIMHYDAQDQAMRHNDFQENFGFSKPGLATPKIVERIEKIMHQGCTPSTSGTP